MLIKKQFPILILLFFTLFSCISKKEPITNDGPVLPDSLIIPPAEIQQTIQDAFPGAIPTTKFADSLFKYLADKYQIGTQDILGGISTCVDDIIYTKNFHHHPEIKGPFHMGGLAGLPFSGVSGLNAFSHHVPDNGAMLLLVGPHIGYSKEKGWGYVLRNGQHEVSSCCGALMGTLANLEKGSIKSGAPDADDYQGSTIAQLALAHREEILNAPNHLIGLTKVTSVEAEAQIKRMLPKVDLTHEHFIIVVGLILINTDYNYRDYVYVTHFTVYDVRNKAFLEEK